MMRHSRFLVAACAALATLAALPSAPAFAAPPKVVAAPLTEQDQADIARIEAYLNDLKTLKAKFLQFSDQGGEARGQFYLSRPGKMRFEYDPPTPILMVSSGSSLVYYDSQLKETSYVPVSSTPLGLLLRDKVKLTGDVTITKLERGPGTIRLSLQQTKDPDQGGLILVFADHPLALRQWTVIDGQRKSTTITLVDMQTDPKLDPSLFQVINPGASHSGEN